MNQEDEVSLENVPIANLLLTKYITDKNNRPQISETALIEKLEQISKMVSAFSSRSKDELSKCLSEVKCYFSNPDLVSNAYKRQGLKNIHNHYLPQILKAEFLLSEIIKNTNFSLSECEKLTKLSFLVQAYKVKKAYQHLKSGKKFVQTGVLNKPSNPAVQKSFSNPIKELSKQNIKKLIHKLSEKGNKSFGLRDDEVLLFTLLVNMPLQCQHATNSYYPIMNSGTLNSLDEINRYNPNYKSGFSTNGNIEKLHNGGFVFFRVYMDGGNVEKTRYGTTILHTDISLLTKIGWISLHDQLKPVLATGAKRIYWEKRLLRTATTININNKLKDKNLMDGIKYTYRSEKFNENMPFSCGKEDTQKSFGAVEGLATTSRTLQFTEEIFYGPDIIKGIALAFIYELRMLESCGFRKIFLQQLYSLHNNKQEVEAYNMLGKLLKGFFRIEGKYPVALQLHMQNNTSIVYRPLINSKSSVKLDVDNPDGDGSFNPDLSINEENLKLSLLKQKKQALSLNARFDAETRQEIENVDQEISQFRSEIEEIINELRELNIDDSKISKISAEKLIVINDHYMDLLKNEIVIIEELINAPLYKLKLLGCDEILDLISNEFFSLKELCELSEEEIEGFINAENLEKAFCEYGYTFATLIKEYRTNQLFFIYATTDDLDELALAQAPDISSSLRKFADDYGVELDFDWIRDSLCETEQVLFDVYLSDEDCNEETEAESEYEDASENEGAVDDLNVRLNKLKMN